MNKKTIKNLFSLFIIQIFIVASAVADELPFSFINNRSVHLRDSRLQNPQVVEANSVISIDPQFLLQVLGTENPSQEQMQRLLLNPGEASNGKIVTQQFSNVTTGHPTNDYFFPVSIKTKDGKIKTGKMAFHAYSRIGTIELKRLDGADPAQFQSPLTTEQLTALHEQNKKATEADACSVCATRPPTSTKPLADIVKALSESPATSSNETWKKYQAFAKEFTENNKIISKARAGYYKRLYIKSMIDKFGVKDTGIILAALTGFAEAPYRNSNETLIAEMAAVIKVVENRATNNFRNKSRTLRDIGISEAADARLTNILSDWQFSAWNDKDNNLTRILSFNPEKSDLVTKRKMMLAFEAQHMMEQNRIEFVGKMNDPKLHHYHANYVTPNWDRAKNRLSSPTVKIDGTSVDLAKQAGARHIFYAGLP